MFKGIKQKLRRRKLRKHGVDIDVQLSLASYGARSGTWTICPALVSPGDIVYSFGVGNNVEWDIAMIEHHQVELHAFDPTPRSVEWIATQAMPASFHFHAFGLSNQDGDMEFHSPATEFKFNYSTHKAKSPHGKLVSCPVRRLQTLLDTLGHQQVEVVKMDIEGGEMDALPDILDHSANIGQLLVEFHYNYPAIKFARFVELVSRLRQCGYRIMHISDRGYEFSFVHESRLSS